MKYLTIPRLQSLASLLNNVDLGDQILHCRLELYSCKQAGEDKKLGKQLEKQWAAEIEANNQLFTLMNNQANNEPTSEQSTVKQSTQTPVFQPLPMTTSPALTAAINQSINQSPIIKQTITQSPSLLPLNLAQSVSPALGPLTDQSTRKLLVSLITTLNAAFPDYDFRSSVHQFVREPNPCVLLNVFKELFLHSLEHVHPGCTAEFTAALEETIDWRSCELYSYHHDEDDFGEDTLEGGGKIWSRIFFLFHRKEKKVLFVSANACSKLHFQEDEEDELDVSITASSSNDEEYDESHGGLVFDDSMFADQSILKMAHSHSMPDRAREADPSTDPLILTRHESVDSGTKKKRSRQVLSSADPKSEKKAKKSTQGKKTTKQSNKQTKKKESKVMEIDGQSDDEQQGGRSLLQRTTKPVVVE